jgi:hypothetical protein
MYVADQLVLKYFAAPILNSIKSKLKNMRTKSSKHFTIEYWVPVLEQMFSMNNSARREGSPILAIETTSNPSFVWISQYLITDYSLGDAQIIYDMVHKYTEAMILSAINTARKSGVYNIQYVNAILEKAVAMAGIEQHKMEKLVTRAETSASILDRELKQHTPLEMAMAQYSWQKIQEDAELERRFNKIMK